MSQTNSKFFSWTEWGIAFLISHKSRAASSKYSLENELFCIENQYNRLFHWQSNFHICANQSISHQNHTNVPTCHTSLCIFVVSNDKIWADIFKNPIFFLRKFLGKWGFQNSANIKSYNFNYFYFLNILHLWWWFVGHVVFAQWSQSEANMAQRYPRWLTLLHQSVMRAS